MVMGFVRVKVTTLLHLSSHPPTGKGCAGGSRPAPDQTTNQRSLAATGEPSNQRASSATTANKPG